MWGILGRVGLRRSGELLAEVVAVKEARGHCVAASLNGDFF